MRASRQFWILKRFADVQISLWTTSDVKVSFRSSRPPWGMMDQRGTYPSVENFMQLCCVPFLLQMCRTGQNLWIFGRAIRVIQWGFTNAWSDKESLLRTTWHPVWKNLLQITSRCGLRRPDFRRRAQVPVDEQVHAHFHAALVSCTRATWSHCTKISSHWVETREDALWSNPWLSAVGSEIKKTRNGRPKTMTT